MLLISSHLKILIVLEAVHLIPFYASKEKIYIYLLLNVSIMSIWEIKLKHQSNGLSTDMILKDKVMGSSFSCKIVRVFLRGQTVMIPLHIQEEPEVSIPLSTAVMVSWQAWHFTGGPRFHSRPHRTTAVVSKLGITLINKVLNYHLAFL